MMPPANSRDRAPLTYHLLDWWMRLIAKLVPEHGRGRWLAEWDGELWYGVAARSEQPRGRTALGLASGLLRDALHVRRHGTSNRSRHDGPGDTFMSSVIRDVRFSLRVLRKAPGFTAVVAITLALGIGGTTTIFSVVNSLLLNPLPYPDADRLMIMWQGRTAADVDKDWFSGGHFTDIRTQTRAFEELTLATGWSSRTMTGRGQATEVGWVQAPSTYLQMLGATAAVGRVFDDRDDQADANSVTLLTYGLWQRAFGGDPGVVGQAITLDGRDVEVVGVLAPGVLLDTEVLPIMGGIGRIDLVLSFPLSGEALADRASEMYNIFGKLKPGVTPAQAQAELDLVAATIQELHERDPNSGFFIRGVPLIDEVVGDVRRALLVLLVAVGGVLLIACFNVANLLLARAGWRRRELGVRAAMGAERGRLVQQLLTESALLATIGGVAGVGLAMAGLSVVHGLGAASLPRVSEIGIDSRVLAFSLALTAVTCLIFGLVPAWRTSRIALADTMRPGGRGTVGAGALWSGFNISSALVVAEVGLSLVLLVGGGLLARSFVALQGVDPGFETAGRLTFSVRLSGEAYNEPVTRVAFFDRLAERLRGLPGVNTVGGVRELPFSGTISWAPVDIENYVPPQGEGHQIISEFRVVLPGYFEAMGIPLIDGRLVGARDGMDQPLVAVIDQHFADTYFPDRDPIGMQFVSWRGTPVTIVGVVGTIKYEALDTSSRVTVYQPYTQVHSRGMYVSVHTMGDPDALVVPVTRTVKELDDGVAVVDVRSMESRLADSLAERRFSMALLQALSIVALILASVGIYGLVSYRVNLGGRELGLRIALGAPKRTILHLVLRHGLVLAALGVVTGLVAASALTGLIRSMLFGVGAVDGWTFAAVSAGLVMTAMVACYLPARRATEVDPLEAIKSE